jgi:hypothetical protein
MSSSTLSRTVAVAALALAVLVTDTQATPAPTPPLPHYGIAFLPLPDAFQTRLDAATDKHAIAEYKYALARLARSPVDLFADVVIAFQVVNAARDAFRSKNESAIDVPLHDLLLAVTDELEQATQAEIDDADEKITRFELANPGFNTNKQRATLSKATQFYGEAKLQLTLYNRLRGYARVLGKLASIEKFDWVPYPSKKCGLKPLQPGETLRGPFQMLNFDTFQLESGWFQANAADSVVDRAPDGHVTAVHLYFNYCNGIDADLTYIEFVVGDGKGNYPQDKNVGGFNRGKGFVNTMGTGSSVSINGGSVAAGYMTGTFGFNSSEGQGTGAFRVFIDAK